MIGALTRCGLYAIVWLSLCLPCIQVSLGLAQVTPSITPTSGAGNLGTIVTPSGNVYDITGGTRPSSGPNLFHSFGEFGVPTNNIANFLNTPVNGSLPLTSNILGRVTGGNPSNIFGTIQTTGFGAANLFLMNPAGIVFGPTASLNVGGSVSFTTSDYLRLADGAKFNAIPGPADASLSSAPVAAFGFLGSNPGAITVQGERLAVAEGQGISLIGGNITVQNGTLENGSVQAAQLSAPGGRIHLASAASSGEFLAGTLDQASNSNSQSFGALGTIQVLQKSVIETSGGGGGTVAIRGGRFILEDSRVSANTTGPGEPGQGIDIHVAQDALIRNGATLNTSILGNATAGVQYGGVTVKADRIEIVRAQGSSATGIFSDVFGSTGGNSGDIALQADSVLMKGSGTSRPILSAGTEESAGNSGNVIVATTGNLEIDRGTIFPSSFFASGNAGNIELTSEHGNILLTRAQVVSQTLESSGNTGKITVTASEGDVLLADITQLSTATRGTGAGGSVEITARNLEMTGRSSISDDNLGPMQPGGITVALSGNLALRDGSQIAPVSRSLTGAPAADFNITAKDILITGSGSRLSSETFRAGQGGILNISAETVQLTNGGQIRSGSTVQPVPPAPTRQIPTGAGGTINIQGTASPARSIVIDGDRSGIFTDAEGTGPGGNINMSAQSVTIQNGGKVSASTSGIQPSATGGNIALTAGQSVSLSNGASVSASSTGPANAGNITINAGSQFFSSNGRVTTKASKASGGNITVQATDSIRLVNSQINTSVEGGPNTAGGNITIDPTFMTLQNSQVLANANQGQGGNINIVAGTFLADQTSRVDASAREGISGTVNIQSPVSSLSNTLATLPQRPLQTQHLLSQRCAAQGNGQLSSLVVAGRDTLPVEPGGWLMSPMALMADDVPVHEAQPVAGYSRDISDQSQLPAGQLSHQLSSSPQRGISDRETGCGS